MLYEKMEWSKAKTYCENEWFKKEVFFDSSHNVWFVPENKILSN